MKTKLIILGLLISCAGFGQVYSLDGGTGTATVDTTNEIATIFYVDSIASEIVAGAVDSSIYATQYYVGQRLDTLSLGFDEATSLDTIVGVSGGSMAVLPFETANVQMKHDTIPIFVFGLGGGLAADTAAFVNNAIAGAFFNSGSDTVHVTSIRGVLAEGSGTETVGVQVSWHATFKSGSATNLNSSALTITSITTGDNDTSFANSVIPPGVFVWCTISGVSAGNKPSLLILQLSGYKVPTY